MYFVRSQKQVILSVLPEALSVFLRPREKGSASMNAVDINRLAQLSRQAQRGLARDHCLGPLFGIQGES